MLITALWPTHSVLPLIHSATASPATLDIFPQQAPVFFLILETPTLIAIASMEPFVWLAMAAII
jgi:hypothetical protein